MPWLPLRSPRAPPPDGPFPCARFLLRFFLRCIEAVSNQKIFDLFITGLIPYRLALLILEVHIRSGLEENLYHFDIIAKRSHH